MLSLVRRHRQLPHPTHCLHLPLCVRACVLPAELDPSEAHAVDPSTGALRFNWSNVCLHHFRRDWLVSVAGQLAAAGRYHVARKQIPSVDGKVGSGVWRKGGWGWFWVP